MSTEFKGLTAVVTGAGSGIGLSVARMLSESGAKVFGLDLSAGEMGSHATFIPCDVSDPSKVAAAFIEIAKATDVIDILANNAGVGAIGSITDAKEEEWTKVFGVNVFGMGRVSAAAMPFLKKSKVASIVNTCSIAATAGLPQRAGRRHWLPGTDQGRCRRRGQGHAPGRAIGRLPRCAGFVQTRSDLQLR